MVNFFNIKYEFDKEQVHAIISKRLHKEGCDYICVADGVVLNNANIDSEYLQAVNGGLFSICDSSYVPIYIRWLYGIKFSQYCGCQIFEDIIRNGKYRMIFMGTSNEILHSLQGRLKAINPDVANMKFIELPYCKVEDFDYPEIANIIEEDGADIIWIALGAPKQEWFMHYLKPHLSHGVMIAVGAAFKFFSGTSANRAPEWMVKNHLEFVYRIFSEPKKQLKRSGMILLNLPKILYEEWQRKRDNRLAINPHS